MSVKPIIFSGPMVRAILDGRKSMTRRVLKPQLRHGLNGAGETISEDYFVWEPRAGQVIPFTESCAYRWCELLPYAPGDLLWVREMFSYRHAWTVDQVGGPIWYWADNNPTRGDWTVPKPSIHMPRWASRLTLEVTDVRVERVQDIDYDDVRAEGVEDDWTCINPGEGSYAIEDRAEDKFERLWNDLNAKRGYGWDANPWVVALTFKVHRCNVDAMP